ANVRGSIARRMGIVGAGYTQTRGMKLSDSKKSRRALTLIDVLVVIVVAFFFITVLVLPSSHGNARVRAQRIHCVNNLKQIGIGFRTWSADHEHLFPWNSPATNGGTAQFATTREVWRHFEIASNEMNSPTIMFCPSHTQR